MAGLDTAKLPRETIRGDVDPYQYAWDLNCSRLDYKPAQKAAIRIKIEKESGEIQRRREEAGEKANRKRSRAAKAQHEASNPRRGETSGSPQRLTGRGHHTP
jgi:hypothetical protein